MTTTFTLEPSTTVRMDLTAVTAEGPFRLEVTHPAKHLVEHFDTAFAAFLRYAEIETALRGDLPASSSAVPTRSEVIARSRTAVTR